MTKRLFAALASALCIASPALAQWQVPTGHAPIGRGAGVTGFASTPTAIIAATAGGTANAIVLTPVTTVTSLNDGMMFQFKATAATTSAALTTVEIAGVSGGARSLRAGDGVAFMWSSDIQIGQVVTVRYVASNNTFVALSPPQSFNQARTAHGSIVMGPNSFSPSTALSTSTWDGGGLLVRNPVTGGFQMHYGVHALPAQELFSGTAYVQGVANQSLSPNTFYYVYRFDPTGTNVFNLEYDFYPNVANAGPTIGDLGIFVKTGDASRTFVGFLYTGSSDIGFKGSGVQPQKMVFSWFNPQLLHMRSDIITVSGVATCPAWTDVTNAAITQVVSAANYLPAYVVNAKYTNTVSGLEGKLRLKVTGNSYDGNGTTTPISGTTGEMAATVDSAGKSAHISTGYANASGDSVEVVTPQVCVEGGTGSFDVQHISYAWQ